MCGIYGYAGKRSALELTLKGLKRLEYRGYDSSGIAGVERGRIVYCKEAGKIAVMEKEALSHEFRSTVAISQTRWATHGRPTRINAHPHLDSGHTLAVVHNGIIENHTALRKMLLEKGVSCISDTDTEVIAQLVAHFYRGDLLQAIGQTLPLLKGSYAVALIHCEEPEKIFCFAHESPLVIGLAEGESFISSDANAFGKEVSRVIYLSGGEIAAIGPGSYELFDSSLIPLEKEAQEILVQPEEIDKGQYAHYTLKEIHENPQAIRSALSARCLEEYGTALFDTLSLDVDELLGVKRILIVSCGTSWHAGLIGAGYLEEQARIPTQVEISSEFRYKNPILPSGTLAIAISQSGETADTLAAVRELKARGVRVIALCNVAESSLVRESDSALFLRAGPEIGVCSTKAFTTQIVVLELFALMLARMRHMGREEGCSYIRELKELPERAESVLRKAGRLRALAEKYSRFDHFFFIGRRFMYPAALEAALKLKEISYINASGYPAGELKHGPIALIGPECPTVALAADSATYEKLLGNLMEIKARGGPILAVAKEGALEIEEIADEVIRIPPVSDALAVVPVSILMQLFAYYIALDRGREIDQPRNLAKSVTVE